MEYIYTSRSTSEFLGQTAGYTGNRLIEYMYIPPSKSDFHEKLIPYMSRFLDKWTVIKGISCTKAHENVSFSIAAIRTEVCVVEKRFHFSAKKMKSAKLFLKQLLNVTLLSFVLEEIFKMK